MTDLAPSILRIIEATGPVGAIIVALLVAMVIGFLLLWRGQAMLAGGAAQQQATEFQTKLLAALDAMTKSEAASRAALQDAMVENAALRRTVGELASSVDLLRAQMRRMLKMLRDIQAGRLAPGEIDLPGDEIHE